MAGDVTTLSWGFKWSGLGFDERAFFEIELQ